LLIADGLDIKTVQMRPRHASAKTTLDVYGHMWPDKDEASRAAVAAATAIRSKIPADSFCGQALLIEPANDWRPRNPGASSAFRG
jgi:hypothetical protein